MKRFTDKLGYANIVASLALFISLSGASYAAITLPANSVGPKQLQSNAVALGNLRFSLGTAGLTSNTPEELASTCGLPSSVVPPIKPPRGGPTPGREVTMSFPHAGSLVVSAVVGLADESTVQGSVPIALELIVDRKRAVVNEVTVTGEQRIQAPIQAIEKVSAGKHTAGMAVRAENCLKGPGYVRLTHVSLIASASPSAAAPK